MTRSVNDDIVFVLFFYNQADYVTESLHSIFNQTVFPSRLIIMDDASTDETVEFINKVLREAPKELIVECIFNSENRGLVGQFNFLKRKITDKLIIVQAGDDISKPYRVEVTYKAWLENNKPSLLIGGYDSINTSSEVIQPFIDSITNEYNAYNIINRKCKVSGCSAAFYSDLLNNYNDLNKNIINEDRITVLRAFMERGTYYIPSSLISYRVGGISSFKIESKSERHHKEIENSRRELIDLEMNLNDVKSKGFNEIEVLIKKRIKEVRFVNKIPLNKFEKLSYFILNIKYISKINKYIRRVYKG